MLYTNNYSTAEKLNFIEKKDLKRKKSKSKFFKNDLIRAVRYLKKIILGNAIHTSNLGGGSGGVLVLWHINLCWLFNAKHSLYLYVCIIWKQIQ